MSEGSTFFFGKIHKMQEKTLQNMAYTKEKHEQLKWQNTEFSNRVRKQMERRNRGR